MQYEHADQNNTQSDGKVPKYPVPFTSPVNNVRRKNRAQERAHCGLRTSAQSSRTPERGTHHEGPPSYLLSSDFSGEYVRNRDASERMNRTEAEGKKNPSTSHRSIRPGAGTPNRTTERNSCGSKILPRNSAVTFHLSLEREHTTGLRPRVCAKGFHIRGPEPRNST